MGNLIIKNCGDETNHAQVGNTGFCKCTHVMYPKTGDDCEFCGKEMLLNKYSALLGCHPECFERHHGNSVSEEQLNQWLAI